jgi:Big-like domain-containing protein/fibronectin type III domain protein
MMDHSALSQLSHIWARLLRTLKPSVYTLLLLLSVQNAFAGPVSLAWNAVPSASVDGYVLYYGVASGSYSMSVDVGNYTTAAVSGLAEGTKYYFAVTAYDVYGQESTFSNEVNYQIPVADGTSPSVAITSPINGSTVPRKSTVGISATATDNTSMAKVDVYVNGQLLCSDATGSYGCNWQVPGAPGRTYQLQAKAYDTLGNVGSSSVVTVTSR